jgi:hypothetical protein
VKGAFVRRPNPKGGFAANGDLTVVHNEWISDVAGGVTDPPALNFTVNPQNSMFLWLCALAIRFEMYEFKSLTFHYVPLCAATTPGTVTFAFDFEATDSDPTVNQVREWKYSSRTNSWSKMSLNVGADERTKGLRYCVSDGATPQSLMRDLGRFFCFATGVGSAIKVGEIRASYAVRLHIPSIGGGVSRQGEYDDALTGTAVFSGLSFYGGSTRKLYFTGVAVPMNYYISDSFNTQNLISNVLCPLGVMTTCFLNSAWHKPGTWQLTINVGDGGGGITGAVAPAITADDNSTVNVDWYTNANDIYNAVYTATITWTGSGVRFVFPSIGTAGALLKLILSSVSLS